MRFKPGYGPGGWQQVSRKATSAPASAFGQIRGIAKFGATDTPFPDVIINFYTRSWVSAGRCVSGADGLFVMTGLVAGVEYIMIAVDPDGGPRYDVIAHVVPAIAAYSGLDPYWSYVASQHLCDGTNGSTTIPDSGPYLLGNASIVNSTTLSTTNPKVGSASSRMPAGSSSWNFSGGASRPLLTQFPVGDHFCIDFWGLIVASTANAQTFFSANTSGDREGIRWDNSSSVFVAMPLGNSGGSMSYGSATLAFMQQWHHYAVAREFTGGNNIYRFYIDLNYIGTVTNNSVQWGVSTGWMVGNFQLHAFGALNGNVDCFRTTKGHYRWNHTTTLAAAGPTVQASLPITDAHYHSVL